MLCLVHLFGRQNILIIIGDKVATDSILMRDAGHINYESYENIYITEFQKRVQLYELDLFYVKKYLKKLMFMIKYNG